MAKKITASVLAFERRLSSSNGLFYGIRWEDRGNSKGRPLPVQEKSVRGVIDHYLKASQATQTKVEAGIENPNLQTVDYCTLGMDEDTLLVKFNIQVAGKIEPCACNSPEVSACVSNMVNEFGQSGFKELCKRYLVNIINGRFLWRNRLGAEEIVVKINMDETDYEFDALAIAVGSFTDIKENIEAVETISDRMAEVLSGQRSHVNLAVNAWVKRFPGMEVFPSQELVADNSSGKGRKSKYLFEAEDNGIKAAALHPQKITNAIHTIDDWYPGAEAPISVNAYGAVTPQGKAFRQPRQDDFYTLFWDNAINKEQGFDSLDADQKKYVMAMLVRGGVLGEGGGE